MNEPSDAVLWHAIRELQSRLDDAEARIDELEGEGAESVARERRKYNLKRRYGGTSEA